MKKDGDFFSALKSKILREPSRAADRAFWKKFESEFAARGRRRSWLAWQRLSPLAAILVMSVGGYWIWQRQMARDAAEDRTVDLAMSTSGEMFEEFEMFAEFADSYGDELPVDDADWDELNRGSG